MLEEENEKIPLEETVKIHNLNSREKIDDLLINEIFTSEHKSADDVIVRWLSDLLKLTKIPITIVCEDYYVDKVYRDEYYRYYSRKHFNISKNCRRLIIFRGNYSCDDLMSKDEEVHKSLEENLVGSIVLKPTNTIGRVLINPHLLSISKCYIKTTKFEIMVYGRTFYIEAFPFSGQDSEVMTCAEVNVWQIMEYFGTRYNQYKVILPTEMLNLIESLSMTRTLPSDGLSPDQESLLFLKSGFSPKVYQKYGAAENDSSVWIEQNYGEPSFEEILHFYVESGIPVLVNLREKNSSIGENHCITCIGHGYKEFDVEKCRNLYKENSSGSIDYLENEVYNKINVLKSWLQYDSYVVMEDHSIPYKNCNINSIFFTENGIEWKIDSFVVPLYHHVFMSAEEAYHIAFKLIESSCNNIVSLISSLAADEITMFDEKPDMVIRLFLTTSKAYKEFRVCNTDLPEEKRYYSQVSYPKYLWVCEYTTPELYRNHEIIGEFVLDATSSAQNQNESVVTVRSPIKSVISVRQGDRVTYRSPDDEVEKAFNARNIVLNCKYRMFEQSNLKFKS